MLKRKLYLLSIGIVVSQLSIAEFWDSRSAKSFGDCATCGSSGQVDFPLGKSNAKLSDVVANIQAKLGKSPTAFALGNGINGAVPDLYQLSSGVNTQADAQAKFLAMSPQAPIVAPQFRMPTQQRIDALFAPTWMQTCLPSQYVYPSTPYYSFPPAWAI